MGHRIFSLGSLLSALLVSGVLAGCSHGSLEARLVALEREADRQAVTRLMHDYAHGIDGFDEDLLRRAFAPDAIAEYKGANFPMDLRLEGVEAIVGWLRESVGHRENAVPWHYMSTARVEVEGDRATMQTFQHNRNMSGVGVYTAEARRDPAGWRLVRLRLDERLLDEELLESMRRNEERGFPLE